MVEDEDVDVCTAARLAALDLMNEKCEGKKGEAVLLSEDTAVFIPEEAVEEIGYGPHSPETPEEREEAIKACMRGTWSREWAESVVGTGASPEVIKRTRRELCEGLYT